MKSKVTFIIATLAALSGACSSSTSPTTSTSSAAPEEITPEDAKAKATAIVPGTALDVAKHDEEDAAHWMVHVKIANGTTITVELFRKDGALDEIAAEEAPFDYDLPAPTTGYLTYGAAKAKALAAQAGKVEKWEVDTAKTQYEFYVRNADERLFEIKLDGKSGELRSMVEKDKPD